MITSDLPDKMYEGMIITYTVKPLFGLPVNWMMLTNGFWQMQNSKSYKSVWLSLVQDDAIPRF